MNAMRFNNMPEKNIKDFTLDELKREMTKAGSPPYRAEQIFHWIYKKGASDFDKMTDIGETLKIELKKRYYISAPGVSGRLKSEDGAEKFVFKLKDGNLVETVTIPSGKRKTLCLSTQVGCRFRCAFCASGLKGFFRNLETAEILDQALFVKYKAGFNVSNYVFMGMGEPLDNYDNLIKSILIMNEPEGLAIGARNITISTCGITPAIKKLKNFKPQINLSVSLHAANDKLRNELMPVNKIYPLEGLLSVLKNYTEKKGRLVTLEYVMIKYKNDSAQDARGLSKIAKTLKAKINLIPYSVVDGRAAKPADKRGIKLFADRLKQHGINVTVRKSKGKDIKAACGQLAGGGEKPYTTEKCKYKGAQRPC